MQKADAEKLLAQARQGHIPQHVAVIMDGNGRWAAGKGLSRIKGHQAGAESIRRIITAARKLGLRYLTLYAFSTENWKRPQAEVSGLFRLMSKFLKKETADMLKNDIRLMTIGDLSRIPEGPRASLEESIRRTAECRSLTVLVALNYGARQEIAAACEKLLRSGLKDAPLQPEDIEKHLDTAGVPDPELMIRTSGEQRLSNFLLWQLSYAELYFTETLWPDFGDAHLYEAVMEFQKRERRFGGL
jgi:undecaprenyl diphosphate synthase